MQPDGTRGPPVACEDDPSSVQVGAAIAILRRMSRPLAISCLCLLALQACGNRITIIECPPGTMAAGDKCVPYDQPPVDTSAPEDVAADPGGLEFPVAEVAPVVDLPTVADQAAPDDESVGPTDPGAEVDSGSAPLGDGSTGEACTANHQCLGGTCLDWPGGYCTKLDCGPSACGEGDACIALPGGNTACLRRCETVLDCQAGGHQGCKAMHPEGGAAAVRVCHGVEADAGPVGSLCAGEAECAADTVCVHTLPGGYCSIEGCTPDLCPAGSVCVEYAGAPICMRLCTADGDCDAAPGAERRCEVVKTVAPAAPPASVCLSGVEGQPIGAQCTTDLECDSGTCEILGNGHCSQSNEPCFGVDDCSGAQLCIITGDNQVGACTQPCSVGLPCPGATACVGAADKEEGSCRVACAGPGALDDCRKDAGLACTFGYALGDTTGQGKYLCARMDAGDLGTSCDAEEPCQTSFCWTPHGAGSGGICAESCNQALYCPFPGTCSVVSATSYACLRACSSVVDCPAGFTCQKPQGSFHLVCM